ncbi:MAG: hypothetical protein CMJ52_05400 [Planctomycetaceae bacterium]|nr:hypothetical protein [Planctomycetaceae bacterium]
MFIIIFIGVDKLAALSTINEMVTGGLFSKRSRLIFLLNQTTFPLMLALAFSFDTGAAVRVKRLMCHHMA